MQQKLSLFIQLDEFQFRWLGIKGMDTAFRISIIPLSNHLN